MKASHITLILFVLFAVNSAFAGQWLYSVPELKAVHIFEDQVQIRGSNALSFMQLLAEAGMDPVETTTRDGIKIFRIPATGGITCSKAECTGTKADGEPLDLPERTFTRLNLMLPWTPLHKNDVYTIDSVGCDFVINRNPNIPTVATPRCVFFYSTPLVK